MIRAILYDLDGVLVEACEWHYVALNKALKKVCNDVINRTEHETVFNGIPTRKKIEILTTQGRMRHEDADRVWDLKQKFTVETINEMASVDHDKLALHESTRKAGIVSVCVTNSITETAHLMLERTGQFNMLAFVITNEMVRNPKPHPEPYIRAMIRLGTMPDEVLVVEDSEKGIQSGMASGANIMIVKNSFGVTAEAVMKEVSSEHRNSHGRSR